MSLVKVDGDTVVAIWKLGSKNGSKKHGSKTHDTPQFHSFYLFLRFLSRKF